MGILDKIRRLVVGTPPLYGDVLPARAFPPVPAFDGRTAALRALREYVTALEFHRENGPGLPPIDFAVQAKNFHIDYPDNEQAIDFAAGTCAVVPVGRFRYEPTGLNTFLDEASWNENGPGTALQVMSSYIEQFGLEYRCALKQQRRAWKAGMEQAFAPAEGVAALRLRTKGYYGVSATFQLIDGALYDNPDEARGRRAVQLGVELRIEVVRLVNVRNMVPVLIPTFDEDEATGQPVTTRHNVPPDA